MSPLFATPSRFRVRLAWRVLSSALAAAGVAAVLLVASSATSTNDASACSLAAIPPAQMAVEAAVVVIATVDDVDGDRSARLRPEVFLKGPVTARPIDLRPDESGCGRAALEEGGRVLAFFYPSDGLSVWPTAVQVYQLKDGKASRGVPDESLDEASLIADVRHLTEQYAVPPAASEAGAGIDWGTTIVPVGGALLLILAVSLALLRVWHRIDPS